MKTARQVAFYRFLDLEGKQHDTAQLAHHASMGFALKRSIMRHCPMDEQQCNALVHVLMHEFQLDIKTVAEETDNIRPISNRRGFNPDDTTVKDMSLD